MSIGLVIFGTASLIALFFAIKGAVKSKEGATGVIANLSIAVWFAAVIGGLAMPQLPGWHPLEILMLAVVVILGLVMVVSNTKHNKMLVDKVKNSGEKRT